MTAKLAKRLSKLRSKKRLSAEEVADRLGVHGILLKRWEKAKEWPDHDMLVKLAEIYEVPPEELISIVENETEYSKSAWASFPYPTVIFVLYLCFGFYTGAWHPAWLVLLTIPIYRWLGERRIKSSRGQ